MDLTALVAAQIAADLKRGFAVTFASDAEKQRHIEKELVGLLGEIGEFANLTKKIGLKLAHPRYEGPSFGEADQDLRAEIADAMIYLFRISAMLGANLEQDVIDKMAANDARYRPLERE